jgi:hypothetical protein
LIQVNPPLQNKDPIIEKICLSYNLVEQYVSSFLQKEILENVAKGLIMSKVHAKERMPKKLPIFLVKFSYIIDISSNIDFEK